jgi:serine/threonine protein phosphatase PrpC
LLQGIGSCDQVNFSFTGISCPGGYPSQTQNTKRKNQDHMFAIPTFGGLSNCHIFGVLDGHGSLGDTVSQFVATQISQHLLQNIASLTSNPSETLQKAFLQADQALSNEAKLDTSLSGTTCVVCLVLDDTVIVANCGDSRCVLGTQSSDISFKNLSADHRPEVLKEKDRIYNHGGRIAPSPTWPSGPRRVWLRSQNTPGLAMTRSIGDKVAHSVGVIPHPDILIHKLDPSADKCIVLASDGIWEFMSSEESIKIINSALDPQVAATLLCHESIKRWSDETGQDDITALVLKFTQKPEN